GSEGTRVVRGGIAGQISNRFGLTAAVQSLDTDAVADSGNRTHDAIIYVRGSGPRALGGELALTTLVRLTSDDLTGVPVPENPLVSGTLKRSPGRAELSWTARGDRGDVARVRLFGLREYVRLD